MPLDVQAVLEQLLAREPLFHRRELVDSAGSFDQEVADDFWEVGASGQVYDRGAVKETVVRRLVGAVDDDLVAEGWQIVDPRVRELGVDTYLLTYTLHASHRVTRRATVWRRDAHRGWHALYHQGTVVAGR